MRLHVEYEHHQYHTSCQTNPTFLTPTCDELAHLLLFRDA